MKRKIGIHRPGVPKNKQDEYQYYFNMFGESRIIGDDEFDHDLDLLVISGGADVDPIRYGEEPHPKAGKPDSSREFFDAYIMPRYIEVGIPIFGICRGLQTLAVHAGLRMIQHYENHDGCYHDVLTQYGYYEVNSLHHQIVEHPNNGDVVKVLATSVKDNTIEALFFEHFQAIGVQWHPELMWDCPLSDMYIEFLLSDDRDFEQLQLREYRGYKSVSTSLAF